MTQAYGIIGWPLGHTMSPTLHNWGFDQLGIDARYETWPLAPCDMAQFMKRVRREPIFGASVTIPHKQTVMDHVDILTDRAKSVGAVNTLYWNGDTLCGDNTDVLGLIAPLEKLDIQPSSAMVLGAGGAARAAVYGLLKLGIPDISIANRTRTKAEALAEDFPVRCVDWADRMNESPDLILNTTPLGMLGDRVDSTPWDGNRFPAGSVAYDIVYNPLKTRFLKEAEAAGCKTLSGLEMFLHQGLAQFRLWTGRDMDEDKARTVLQNALKS